VSDWEKLRRVADFTSGYLHLEEHPDERAVDWRSRVAEPIADGDARIA
jgi:hypothetical protein